MRRSASIAFTHSCPPSRASPLASCGGRWMRWTATCAPQSAPLVDYTERHRAGLRVGTSLTEGTANFLVNPRIAKSQQMRWSRRGADLLLQVRCAVALNGTARVRVLGKESPSYAAQLPTPTKLIRATRWHVGA